MSDTEIMSAIGADYQHDDERPALTKEKKSFLQKWNDTHEALKIHMRSLQTTNIQPEEQQGPSRTSSSSSASKDFFKMSPTTRKAERTISAVRYDDIASDIRPSPTSVIPPPTAQCGLGLKSSGQSSIADMDREWIRDFVPSDAPTHRLHSLHTSASMGSLRPSPTHSTENFRVFRRSRSLPHQMSDEEMDAWLETPEDAEVHRLRTLSERILTSSVPASKRGSVASFEQKQRHRKHVITRKQVPSPRALSKEQSTIMPVEEEPEVPDISAEDVVPPLMDGALSKNAVCFASLPNEVLLEIARNLDTKSVMHFRATSKSICDTIVAPLAPKKT